MAIKIVEGKKFRLLAGPYKDYEKAMLKKVVKDQCDAQCEVYLEKTPDGVLVYREDEGWIDNTELEKD